MSPPAPGWFSIPYFSAPKMAWLRRNVERGGVVTTSDSWLLHRLTGEFVTDATTASRSLLVELGAHDFDATLLDLFGLAGERLPRIVGNDEIIGTTTAFGGDSSGRRSGRRSAGRAAGRSLPAARHGQVHLRNRCLPAGQHRRRPGALVGRADHIRRVADSRCRHLLRRRAGLHRGLGGALAVVTGCHRRRRGARRRRGRRQRRRAVRPGAGRPGRAVVAIGRHRNVFRPDPGNRPRPPGARGTARHRRADRRTGIGDRNRHRQRR